MSRGILLAVALAGCAAGEKGTETGTTDLDGDGVAAFEDCDDGDPDQGAPATWYPDQDGDGWGGEPAVAACRAPEAHVTAGGDCDDHDAGVHPEAVETCDDADRDEDCDGLADDEDPEADGRKTFFRDADGDGIGDEPVEACDAAGDRVAHGGDCDDADAAVHPGAPELCDGRDNACREDWAEEEETGRVSFRDAAGTWSDRTDLLGGGTGPAALSLEEDGTWSFCTGRFPVTLRVVRAVEVAVVGAGVGETILDAQGRDPVVRVEADGARVTLEGLELRAGAGTWGGGLRLAAGSAVVTDCALVENQAELGGGAFAAGPLEVVRTRFEGNQAARGAGLAVAEGAAVRVQDATFEGNAASSAGGGLHATDVEVTIAGGTFRGNRATWGAGAWVSGGSLGLDGTHFASNQAVEDGGALYLSITSTECVGAAGFTANVAGRTGGAAYVEGSHLTSEACDWGAPGPDENTPQDVHTEGSAYSGDYAYGAGASFVCGPSGTCG